MKFHQDMEKMSLKKKRKLNLLAIGDSHVGKTTFLTHYCSQQSFLSADMTSSTFEKVNKTNGCDIHICYHTPNTRALLSDPSTESSPKHFSSDYGEEMEVHVWDLAGEVKQREFLNVFTTNKLHKLDAILFFFDLTNLKTFSNLYKWLIAIFHNNAHKKNYARVWSIPFLLIGTKVDQMPTKYADQIKVKLLKQLNKMFLCTTGENLLFVNANDIDAHAQKIQMIQFNMFLSAICIEKTKSYLKSDTRTEKQSYESLQLISSHSQERSSFQCLRESEYALKGNKASEVILGKNVALKFLLNKDNYKNKRMIEDDKNLMQIVMEVNQLKDYQRVMHSHIKSFYKRGLELKERIASIFFSQQPKKQSNSTNLQHESELDLSRENQV